MLDRDSKLPKAKERTIQDLTQFVKNRTDSISNYTMLLGAGASVTSGVRSATELVEEWRREVYERYCSSPVKPYDIDTARDALSREHSQWYSQQSEYASLFEKKFDLPRQRRMFVEREVSGKFPSLGYAYLIRLVQEDFFNTIFTTNFDDLLNEAFHQFSDVRPIVCAHDSAISSITVTSKRPKIIKLHGDYLFDDIKSTVRETESLEENMRRKFVEFSKDHGLIVIGYGACDRSIMDVLQRLLKHDDYFKNGIYWCVRGNTPPSEELVQLLWRERVYWVRIDGFDELMAELYDECLGSVLPLDTSLVSDKPRELIGRFCQDSYLEKSSCKRIKQDLSRFKQELDQEAIVQSLRDVTRGDDESSEDSGLSDREFFKLMAVKRLVEAGAFDKARARIKEELAQTTNPELRGVLFSHRLAIEQVSGQWVEAIATCEDMLANDPKDASVLLSRSKCERSFDAKCKTINQAIELDPYLPSAFRYRAGLRERQIKGDPGCDVHKIAIAVCDDYLRSIELNPSTANASWQGLASFLMSRRCPLEDAGERVQKILEELEFRDPFSRTFLAILANQKMKDKKDEDARTAVLNRIREGISNQPRARKRVLELLLLSTLKGFRRFPELLRSVSGYDGESKWQGDEEFLKLRSDIYLEVEGKPHEAIRLLKGSKRYSRDSEMISSVVKSFCILGKAREARREFEEHQDTLSKDWRESLLTEIFSAEGNLEELLAHTRRMKLASAFPANFAVSETHTLLKLARYSEAEDVAREILDRAHFSKPFDELIVNYELSVQRQGRKIDKARLSKIVERHDDTDLILICACYLLEDKDKAAQYIVRAVQDDRSEAFDLAGWAIFDTPVAMAWLQGVLKSKALIAEVGIGENRKVANNG